MNEIPRTFANETHAKIIKRQRRAEHSGSQTEEEHMTGGTCY